MSIFLSDGRPNHAAAFHRGETGRTLHLVLAFLVLSGLAAAGVFSAAVYMMKRSPAYLAAESFVRKSPEIRAVAGPDMRFGFVPRGVVRADWHEGTSRILMNVLGSQGGTRVEVLSRGRANTWTVVSARYADSSGAWHTVVPAVPATPQGPPREQAMQAARHAAAALAFFEANKPGDAVAEYGRALAANPADAELYYWRAAAFVREGQDDHAIADLEKAIELEPTKFAAYEYLDSILNRQRAYQKVVALWSGLIALQPDNGAAYFFRAGGYLNTGRRDEALRDARKSCELGNLNGCRIQKRLEQHKL